MNRTLMIVFEETGEEAGLAFNVYLSGDAERLNVISTKDMSPAELWASKVFGVAISMLKQSGVVENEIAVSDLKNFTGQVH